MNSKSRTFLSVFVIVLAVVILQIFGVLKPIEKAVLGLVNPASNAMHALNIKVGSGEENFDSVDDLKEAYKKAKERITELEVDEAKMFILQDENLELRSQLSYVTSSPRESVGADVIGKNIEPIGSTLVLNKGSEDGLQVGDPVIIRNGILIGIVARTEESFSIVRLVDDNQSRIAATITNMDRSTGLVEGRHGISISMSLIPQNEEISIGNIVLTSGLEDDIPRGLSIGKITSIEKEPFQPFQKAAVDPLVSFDKVSVVSVLIKKPEAPKKGLIEQAKEISEQED